MALKDMEARNAAPRERAYKLADGEGLYFLVQPNGAKLWLMTVPSRMMQPSQRLEVARGAKNIRYLKVMDACYLGCYLRDIAGAI
jgi:hypothetical protein